YLIDERARALGSGEHILRIAALGGSCGRALQQHLGVAEDAAEDVVEVVRDAASEAPDRLHLRRLAKPRLESRALGLGKLSLGDVAQVDDDGTDARLMQQVRRGDLHPTPRAVAMLQQVLA